MADLPLYTSDIHQAVKIRMGSDGFSALEPKTVMQYFDEVVAKHGDKAALYEKVPVKDLKTSEQPYTMWTWKEYRGKVDAFAKSLMSLGFEPFDIINIIGFNSREWFVSDLGAIAAGGVAAGIYTTNLPDACKYISSHSAAKVIVVDGIHQLKKYIGIAKDLPALKAIVMWGSEDLPPDIQTTCPSVPVYTFDTFLTLGTDVSDELLTARKDALAPNQTCTLIYTSGTTGPPKAVMITHDNITWVVRVTLTCTPNGVDETDSMISFLPLSHVAAQLIDIHMPLVTGSTTYFAMPDALKGSLGMTLKEVRPTFFFAVPRVFEKIYEKMMHVVKSMTGVQKSMSTWAKDQIIHYWESNEYGAADSASFDFFYPITAMNTFIARKLVHKVHVALGLDRCKGIFVSAAPIEVKILKYFASLDLPIMELFGQSECSGPHSVNTLRAFKFGTVGRPLQGTETKLDPETGELCYRGRHIFAGYMKMPDKTAEAIDSEGWLHSGDVVKIDDDHDPRIPKPSGFLSITGRIKEIIITAGGENVPPVLIEDQLKFAMHAISNCMVIGDKRKFLSVILCLKVHLDEHGVPTHKLSDVAIETSIAIGSAATTTDEARECSKWKDYFDNGVKEANSKAASRAQTVGKWVLLSTDFSVDGGELTPTLKLKRDVAAKKYSDVIEAIYA